MSSRFLLESAVGSGVKGFTDVRADNVHSLSLICQAGHHVIEEDQVCQAGPASHEPTLARPDLLAFLHVMSLKMTCFMTFPGTEVRLTGL